METRLPRDQKLLTYIRLCSSFLLSLSLVRWNASWEIASNAIVFGHTRRPYGTNNREEAFPFKEKVFVELKSLKLLVITSVEGDNRVFDWSP